MQINAAIGALPTEGGEVVLSEGLFTITARIDIGVRRLILRGHGTDVTKILAGANISTGGISVGTGASAPTVYLRDFHYDGVKATYTTGSHGIDLTWCPVGTVENVNVLNCVGSGFYADKSIGPCDGIRMYNCRSISNSGSGYFLSSNGVQVYGCYSLTNGVHGFYTDGGESLIVSFSADQDTDRGIIINAASRTSVVNCSASDIVGDASGASIEIRTSSNTSVIGCRVLNGGNTIGNVAGILLIGGSEYCSIIGNQVEDTNAETTVRAGIYLADSKYNVVSGNTLEVTKGRGLRETGTADFNLFSNNRITDFAGASAFVGASSRIENNMPTTVTSSSNASALPVEMSTMISLTTSSGNETRTLAAPSFLGQELTLYLKTNGGTDCTVTCSTTIAEDGSNTILFNATGESLFLRAVEEGSNLRWRCAVADGATVTTV